MEIYTIGFAKKKAEEFFGALRKARIKRLIDVRLNNTSQLAGFTKKDDLQFFLKELCGADYVHEPLLAPTPDILISYKKKKINWQEYEKRFLDLKVTPNPQRPEIEDHIFSPSSVRKMDTFSKKQFWRLVNQMVKRKLSDIFGTSLEMRGAKSCAVDVGKGEASLGCFLPDSQPKLYVQPRKGKPDQIRIQINDGCFDLDIGVTDIRLYGEDHAASNKKVVKNVVGRLREGEDVIP